MQVYSIDMEIDPDVDAMIRIVMFMTECIALPIECRAVWSGRRPSLPP